jgi:hypothetical protein
MTHIIVPLKHDKKLLYYYSLLRISTNKSLSRSKDQNIEFNSYK